MWRKIHPEFTAFQPKDAKYRIVKFFLRMKPDEIYPAKPGFEP